MFKFYKRKVVLFVVIIVILMFSLAISYGNCEAKYKFNCPIVDPLWGEAGIFAQIFAQSIKVASVGDIEINIYPNGEWGGDEEEYLKSIQLGTLDMSPITVSAISRYTRALSVYDSPFLFKGTLSEILFTFESLTKHTPVVERQLKEASEESKFVLLSIAPLGRCDVWANKPINSSKDLKGLKFRTLSSKLQVDGWKSAGVNATPLPYSEVFTSLRLKIIDAFEQSANIYVEKRFFEVAPYGLATNHWASTTAIVISKKAWDSLPPSYQSIVKGCAVKSAYTASMWALGAAEVYLKGPVEKVAKKMVYLSPEDQKKLRETVLPKFLDKHSEDITIEVLEALAENDEVVKAWVEKNK